MEPKATKDSPYLIEESAGKKAWCACGLSKNQPYCDGSHKGTDLSPIIVEIEKPRKVAWCGCRKSNRKPFCDGSHVELP